MPRHLDMDLLRALVATADAASFSLAASRLGRTQSAVSLQIKRLEDLVGHPLLVRSQGRLDGPTPEGLLLLDYARRILRLNDEAVGCFAEPELAGSLRVGLAEEIMERDLAGVMEDFHQAYPRVRLALECDLSARLAARVQAGELDMALIKRIGTQPTAEGRPLWREPMVWVTGERGGAAQERPLPLALFQETCIFRVVAQAALSQAGIPWRQAFSGHSHTGLRQAVAAGLAVTPLPASLLGPGLARVRDGLPALPDVEWVALFAPDGEWPAATRLVEMFEARLWQGRAGGLGNAGAAGGAAPRREPLPA
ncbi:LysR substrate-binding domain-containing protein [Oryzomicrobium sp.]|uniref:LysR substrate-binding domain-containing protein n=1 Tax=Oryzomicrobium sp. TaxID=1911578 RepID=UPI0025E510F9|nr:LysR substrate-binding domain-containing protein [Oryzomicrobium sp.]MCE1241639.1 LysR substrate-binding domain-containing protein [Oryzomicrobium sp.]